MLMLSFRASSVFLTAFLPALALLHEASAEPNPRQRSFRPVVPIKQNVRGGLDQMKSQTVKLTIPPPPIDASSAAVPSPSLAEDSDLPAPEMTGADLPPESKPALSGGETSSDAADPEELGGSGTPKSTEPSDDKKPKGPTLSQLRNEAHALAGKKLRYVFGADDPDSGGLDCSSTIQQLLTKIGVEGVPRTSYDQYYWLKRKKLLDDVYGKGASSKLLKKLSPGDLIFWGGTWKSGHRVSHVMLYMGYDPAADKHYVFGARSKNSTGLTGSGVDIFELDTEKGRLVAHGKIPGLVYD